MTSPIRVFDTYTKRCNFDCPQCYFACGNLVDEERRTLEQTIAILQKFYQAGTTEWRFTGGEPLIQPDIFEAIAVAKGLGMNVGLYTNGWWTDRIVGRVLDVGLDEIVISLEGRREINDQRRKAGSFDRAMQSFTRLSEYNRRYPSKKINVNIATAVGRDNVSEVEFLALLAARHGFNIVFMPLKPSGRARSILQTTMLSTYEYMAFVREVQRVREQPEVANSGIRVILKYKDLFCPDYPDKSGRPFPFNYSECGALTTAISMMPDGRVFSCPFVLEADAVGQFMGPNMNEVSVQQAWHHPNFKSFRNAQKVNCTDCTYYMRQCRGACRATVLGYGGEIGDGKLIGEDPQCFASLMSKDG